VEGIEEFDEFKYAEMLREVSRIHFNTFGAPRDTGKAYFHKNALYVSFKSSTKFNK
jgi:hypothetical protein